MTAAQVFDHRVCQLGEGPLWHPLLSRFFWFDILGQRLLSRGADGTGEWHFDRIASAAGWVDDDRLLVATETGLAVLTLSTGALDDLIAVEADDPTTRSNDGRADPQGGFWFGTMAKDGKGKNGALYRFYRGEVRKLADPLGIPNSICFAPDGDVAYLSDTQDQVIWRQALDADGWPVGPRQVQLDLSTRDLNPDGAVTDADGALCVALWGEGAVARFDAHGAELGRWSVGGQHSSCPAFGGPDMEQMIVTTARDGIEKPDAGQGLTYITTPGIRGRAEPCVIL